MSTEPRSHGSPWESAIAVAAYAGTRSRIGDFYRSEQRLVPSVARLGGRLIDVGCASGGFQSAWASLNPAIEYVGVDVSQALIEQARRLAPRALFHVADAAEVLPFEAGAGTSVVALGWLHLEPRWKTALKELGRVADRALMCDFRIAPPGTDSHEGRQRIEHLGQWDGSSVSPYLVVLWDEVVQEIESLGPQTVIGVGYVGPPAATVSGVPAEVCFATFLLLFDTGAKAAPDVALDLPFVWPTGHGRVVRDENWLNGVVGASVESVEATT